MYVTKRDGRKEPVSFDKVLKRIKNQSKNLKTDYHKVAQQVIMQLANEVSTKEIDNLTSMTSFAMVTTHPDYSKLASNIAISRLHKETKPFYEATEDLYNAGLLNKEYFEKVKKNRSLIEAKIDYQRDYLFEYFGYKTLEQGYLLKIGGKAIERPQGMYMRIALTLFDNFEDISDYYDELSYQKVSSATPIAYNSGTVNQNLISCSLIQNKGDSLELLCDTYKDVARTSADAAGIGLGITNIRSKESTISTSGGKAAGLLKQLKIYNELARCYDQQSKRKGSFAVYVEVWHKDLKDVLEMRKETGAEELRAKDLFSAVWIPDNFMRAVVDNGDYYQFCPNEIIKAGLTPLQNLHGELFEIEYQKAVDLGLGKKVKAQDIWRDICVAQIETGLPYIGFKDNVNNKTNHQNYGTITQSNLCIEIMQYTGSKTQAICTLSSIPLHKHINKGKFDFKSLENSVRKVTRALNNVFKVNKYSTEDAKYGGLKQRAIGIGVQGLADTFALLDMSFGDELSKMLNKDIFETIYYAALSESNAIAKEQGIIYDGFFGSPASKCILQYDMWNKTEEVESKGRHDWQALKESIKEYGLANSLVTALMPTQSSANIIGSNEGFEPFVNNIYSRKVLSGEYVILNKYLVNDLEKVGQWNEETKNKIIFNNGSVQWLSDEHQLIKNKYKTIWEMKMRTIIDMAADRGAFIDQSQSMNLFVAEPTIPILSSMHTYSWQQGLKTGIYYLRTRRSLDSQKTLAVSQAEQKTPTEEEKMACSIEAMQNGEDCNMCSA